jgi:PKD repeat protein
MRIQRRKRTVFIGIMLILTAFASITTNVSATGLPPVAEANGPYIGNESEPMILSALNSYDPDGTPLMYRWNIDGYWTAYMTNSSLDWTWLDDFSGNITLEVSNGDLTATDNASVTISNVPPIIIRITGLMEVELGNELPLSVNFFDGLPDPRGLIASLDTYNATFYWDDGSSTILPLGIGEFWANATHMYTEVGIYYIVITIMDDNGGEVNAYWEVSVNEKLVKAGRDSVIDEGLMFISDGYLADTDSTSYNAIVDYGDGTGTQPLLLNQGNTFDLQHLYLENGVYTVLVTVFNEGEIWGLDNSVVTVNNVPPFIESMSVLPTDPLPPGVPVELTTIFSDQGILDTHTATIDWGDGETSSSDVIPAETYLFTENHTYANAGAYMITLTVSDDDGGSDSMTIEYTLEYNIMNIDTGPDGNINEGDIFTSNGSFTCSEDGLYTATVEYGDGSGSQSLSLSSGYLFNLSHQYLQNGLYTIIVTIFKDGVAFISDSALVTVYNVAPIITSLLRSPTGLVPLGNAIYLV